MELINVEQTARSHGAELHEIMKGEYRLQSGPVSVFLYGEKVGSNLRCHRFASGFSLFHEGHFLFSTLTGLAFPAVIIDNVLHLVLPGHSSHLKIRIYLFEGLRTEIELSDPRQGFQLLIHIPYVGYSNGIGEISFLGLHYQHIQCAVRLTSQESWFHMYFDVLPGIMQGYYAPWNRYVRIPVARLWTAINSGTRSEMMRYAFHSSEMLSEGVVNWHAWFRNALVLNMDLLDMEYRRRKVQLANLSPEAVQELAYFIAFAPRKAKVIRNFLRRLKCHISENPRKEAMVEKLREYVEYFLYHTGPCPWAYV